jgi:hypothetical protein
MKQVADGFSGQGSEGYSMKDPKKITKPDLG